MKDIYELGTTPYEEECVQVSKTEEYYPAMLEECNKYKTMLEERFINLPMGVHFKIKRNNHDFGDYCEVAIVYNPDRETDEFAMIFVENNLPATWTDIQVFDVKKAYELELGLTEEEHELQEVAY